MQKVYKILTSQEWSSFQNDKYFRGSIHDRRDGFIHLCLEMQVERTIKKYFDGISNLYLLELEFQESGTQLKHERNSSGVNYPHYYGELVIENIKSYKKIR